jgi:hypothetical protein
MKNVIELSSIELETVSGGATFAYRVGQCIRWFAMTTSGIPAQHAIRDVEMQYL